jgi:hypothetical protein
MKYLFLPFLLLASTLTNAQSIQDFLKKANVSLPTSKSGASSDQIANGLKEALQIGAENGCAKLSKPDGFFKNAALKILMPPEAQKIESTLRNIGLGQIVDDFILSMNRAAEDACKTAGPIFLKAIKEITINDGINILQGPDNAATNYLKTKTQKELTNSFKPVINQSLEKVDATKYWGSVIDAYNAIPFTSNKLNPDLAGYVTDKSLTGIYTEIAAQEKEIRSNPMARTSELLKTVFNRK